MKVGPDAVHAFKRDPRTGEWYSNQTWDFVATHPEALQTQLMMWTDRVGTPKSFRMQNFFPCNTFSMINAQKVLSSFLLFLLSHPFVVISSFSGDCRTFVFTNNNTFKLGEILGEIPLGEPTRMGGNDERPGRIDCRLVTKIKI